jgi:hypothetical protein
MKLWQLALLGLLLFLWSASWAGTQRALLIGISNYQSGLPPLAGSRNDVLLIRELLAQKYGFDRANIRIMIDEEATRAGIFAAVRELSEVAAPDDIVLIHYSGHGSQAPDTNGDEPDGKDETILPYDSRMPGIPDITDDDLNALIGSFRSESVIVVLDSCHSGTGTRSGPSQVAQRWVAPDTRRELYEKIATRQVVNLPISENHVFFAAAQESESELDGPFGPDNMRLGLFTAAMVGVLAMAPADVTPRQAIEGVNARVEALKANAAGMPIPEPNMEAPLHKHEKPLFVFRDTPAPQWAPEPTATPPQYTAAEQPSFGEARSIFATANGSPQLSLARSVVESIGSGLSVAPTIEEADAVIDAVGTDTYDVYGPNGVVRIATGLGRSAAVAAGTATSGPNDFRFLKSILLNAPTIADLLSLENPNPTINLSLRAAGVADVRSRNVTTRTVKLSVNTGNHRLQYYQEGMPRTRANSLQLEVTSNSDCYLTLLSVNAVGGVYLLLPNAGQELSGFLRQGRLTAGATTLIPDSLAEDNLAGFHYDYVPPGGVDRVIGVCFVAHEDAERFRAQIAKLELGGTLEADLFALGSRGVTNVTPGQATPPQTTPAWPQQEAPPQTSPAWPQQEASPPQAPAQQAPAPSVPQQMYATTSASDARWAAAKVSLTVGR